MAHTDFSNLKVVGIDIGKDVFHLVGFDCGGKLVLRKKIKWLALGQIFEQFPKCIIGMEACLSAHFVSRSLSKLGFDTRIISAKYTKPCNKGQKSDYNDAEAIAEAALRPNLKTVRQKCQEQLYLQALHRVRSRLVSRRTSTINQICAFLLEQGITVRTGAAALRKSLFPILENRSCEISPRMNNILVDLYEDWFRLDERIESITKEIEDISHKDKDCKRLMTIPGIGPFISTSIISAIGGGDSFERGQDFGAWLGLVPRQYSTGGKPILGKISKTGNIHIRTFLVQAAHVLLMRPQSWQKFSFGRWLEKASQHLYKNKLAVALANKLARIAWSVLYHEQEFDTHNAGLKVI